LADMLFKPEKVERELAGRLITLQTGDLAMQAGGAVTVSYGDTIVLVTV
jgi:polyribonucleotide nucleotidyltransferase